MSGDREKDGRIVAWSFTSTVNCIAIRVHRHTADLSTPSVCVATASPAKFPEAVKAAGIEMPLPPKLAQLLTSPARYKEMKKGEDWDEILRTMINDISKKRSENEPLHSGERANSF